MTTDVVAPRTTVGADADDTRAALPLAGNAFTVLGPRREEALAIVRDNLGDEQLRASDLTTVKIPAGGATQFAVPGLTGERYEQSLTGVIVDVRHRRAFWPSADPTPGTPPECRSDDARLGQGIFGPGSAGNPTGACSRCPMAIIPDQTTRPDQPPAGGAPCREYRDVFLLRAHDILPTRVQLPRTSIAALRKFRLDLGEHGLHLYGAVVRVTVERRRSRENLPYGRAVFNAVARLSDEETARMAAYAAEIAPLLGSLVDEVERETEPPETPETPDIVETPETPEAPAPPETPPAEPEPEPEPPVTPEPPSAPEPEPPAPEPEPDADEPEKVRA